MAFGFFKPLFLHVFIFLISALERAPVVFSVARSLDVCQRYDYTVISELIGSRALNSTTGCYATGVVESAVINYASPESKHVLRCNTYDYRGVFR